MIIAVHPLPFWLKMGIAILFQQRPGKMDKCWLGHLDLILASFLEALASPTDLDRFFESIPCLSAGLTEAVVVLDLQVFFAVVVVLVRVVAYSSINMVRSRRIKLDGFLKRLGLIPMCPYRLPFFHQWIAAIIHPTSNL